MTLSELRARVETDVLTVDQARALIDAAEALEGVLRLLDDKRIIWYGSIVHKEIRAALSALRDAGLEVT